jgi:hypothetical protein
MKRLIALLASVTAVFVVAAGPIAADPNAPASVGSGSTSPAAPTVPKDAIGLSPAQIAGSGLAVTLDPGASEEHDLVVSNHTANLRLTVKLDATDATGNVSGGAASWLAFGDDEIQLDPHVATTVPMTIAVPHDTQPGSVLAHVSATVESAASAADGSPVDGTATVVFPVSIVVSGTPSAQIAIADVHRVDQGSNHQLAVVLRNFGAQGAQVSGHVRVAGDTPQTLPFHADLAGGQDTTLDLGWHAPPVGTATDIAVDLEYGAGDVASWSSQLGGAATNLSATSVPVAPPPTVSASDTLASATTTGSPSKPLWKQPLATMLAILMVLAAGSWFAFEMRSSRRRRDWAPQPARYAMPPGWDSAANAESIDLAKQIVRLTDVVVQLVESHRVGLDVADERARARSPDRETEWERAAASAPPTAPGRVEPDHLRPARAGPEPPNPPELAPVRAVPVSPPETTIEPARSASPTPGAPSRPEPVDPRAAVMARLTELDRQRWRLRDWMDDEESGAVLEPRSARPTPQPTPNARVERPTTDLGARAP